MAEQQQQQPNLMAQVPPGPPLFWKQFTTDNLERIEKLRAENFPNYKVANNTPYKLPPRIHDVPAELRFLQPPEPPASGVYRTFGQIRQIKNELPPLEEGIEQIYTPPTTPTGTGNHEDRKLILKRFAKSLLLNIFANFHHLLNEYRPYQARESLIAMMQDQLDKSRAETEGIMKMKEKVEGMLEGFGEIKLGDEANTNSQEHENVIEDDGKDIWEQLDLEFG